jgi:hypothetical protein
VGEEGRVTRSRTGERREARLSELRVAYDHYCAAARHHAWRSILLVV